MTSVTESRFTGSDPAGLLLAVGAEPPVGPAGFEASFQDLGLDSPARTETATPVARRWGVSVEQELTPDSTPADVRRPVTEAVAAR